MHSTQPQLDAIEAELARQDAEWRDAQEQLRAEPDVQLLVDPAALEELTELQAVAATLIPLCFTRA